jgi:hypothetical protein
MDTAAGPPKLSTLRCLSAGFSADGSRSSGMFVSRRLTDGLVEMPVVTRDPVRSLTGTRVGAKAQTPAIIRPTFYRCLTPRLLLWLSRQTQVELDRPPGVGARLPGCERRARARSCAGGRGGSLSADRRRRRRRDARDLAVRSPTRRTCTPTRAHRTRRARGGRGSRSQQVT